LGEKVKRKRKRGKCEEIMRKDKDKEGIDFSRVKQMQNGNKLSQKGRLRSNLWRIARKQKNTVSLRGEF
jgi:hypothetical protein